MVIGYVTGTEKDQHNNLRRLLRRSDLKCRVEVGWTIGQFVGLEMPGTGTRKYDSKKALPAPNRKVARTTLAGSRRLSIEAIVQRTSIEGAMAAVPRVDGRAAKISFPIRSIGWQPIK